MNDRCPRDSRSLDASPRPFHSQRSVGPRPTRGPSLPKTARLLPGSRSLDASLARVVADSTVGAVL